MDTLASEEKSTGPAPPPPYGEASAYQHAKLQPPRRLRRIFSLRLVLALVLVSLTVQLSWLYLWNPRGGHARGALTALESKTFALGLASCAAHSEMPIRLEPRDRKENPRWDPARGQNDTIVLRNATLFDGDGFLSSPVDITFSRGLITSVSPAAAVEQGAAAREYPLHGAYVTPGLVDMHSHHLVMAWPGLASTEDSNEVHEAFGPLTPFVRAVDSMKAYDAATRRIAAGGVTSGLIIPGSANIMGGEGAVVKNAVRPGPAGEFVVEEMLLEHGVVAPGAARHRYMKMACGENPKQAYGHTRMGNVWVLRAWLARARALVDRQDAWCEAARGAAAAASTDAARAAAAAALLAERGGHPEELELESTAAMLRGQVAMHNHCYEPEDMETMLRVSREFGFRVRAFHHAISAWQVPEMLKEYGENITVATFAEFGLYKKEAYAANLWAGKILNDHDIPVAYKSDHTGEVMSAQYLLLQAAVAHSFGLPEDKALQSVTSVPARAIDLDDRVGYARPGYDADLVVWDSHPLSVGATPRQVYIDGVATLDPLQVEESAARVVAAKQEGLKQAAPAPRATVSADERKRLCGRSREPGRAFVITGLTKVFLDEFPGLLPAARGGDGGSSREGDRLTLVIADGEVACLGSDRSCSAAADRVHEQQRDKDDDGVVYVQLRDGHLTRGLTAVTTSLGLQEIAMDPATGDGEGDVVDLRQETKDPGNIDFAKYGVSMGGSGVKAQGFARARLGGITRVIQPPLPKGGMMLGVSTGMRTGLQSTLLNGGLFQEDVALHVALGESAKANEGTISMAIERLRALIKAGGKKKEAGDVEDPWVLVANGTLPLVVKADSNHDIQQVILLKKDFPDINAVIFGAHEATLFAREIAEAKIPLILTATRPSPDSWSSKDSLPGPPLSRSPADVLHEAGVFYGIALNTDGGPPGDSRIQSLALEASWTAKFAGLSEHEALGLVSTNVEAILGLEKSGDMVVWEGDPLQFGTPVLAFQSQGGQLHVGSCWPNEVDE